MTTPKATRGRDITEASPAPRRPSAAMNQLLAAASQGQGPLTNGTSSASAIPSPEEIYAADMNDLTDIRKSSHQTYTPTMRRWKDFCDRHREEYGGPDGRAVYLVDSEEKVGKFLEEQVIVRTKAKRRRSTSVTGEATLGFVEVTVGPDAVKMARSSLGRIHRLQMGRKEVSELAPSDMKVFQTKIMHCQKILDERENIQPGVVRGRDYYSLDNMVTALNVLWDNPDPRKEYGQSFMDMFCISATHNMLLRDEELHHINFSDCFAVVLTQNRQPGAQQRVALTFKLRYNNPTSDANQKLYVSALRHYDVGRCTFSAFAFYMFQIWQGTTDREPRSNRTLSAIFRDLGKEEWPSFKLLPSTSDPTVSSLPTTLWSAIKKTFKTLGVNCPRKADGGRHVGTIEATKLKIPQGDIDDKGRWSVERGMYGECQIPQLHTTIPGGMAGFLDTPYSLARNRVTPPIPLQMLIFPWIEFAFGVNNAWWKQECLDEMNEVAKDSTAATTSAKSSRKDSKASTNGHKVASGKSMKGVKGKQVERDGHDDDDDEADSPQDETSDAESADDSAASVHSTSISHPHEREASSSADDTDRPPPPASFSEAYKVKAGFLRLLVRCRRIILQDAAYRLHRRQPNKILDHDIFRCTMFKSFLQEIGAAVDKDSGLSRKRPRQKSPSTTATPTRPVYKAETQPPVQQHQQQQHAVVIDQEDQEDHAS
ncbi:hypothetical protein BGZ96_007116, partial [Linnemannia gamsii]